MNAKLMEFIKNVRPLMLRHLEEDILPYWLLPAMLGDPVGDFPTWADQSGRPVGGKPRYVRMHGRQTYAYLVAYHLLHKDELLDYGLAGLKKLKDYENPKGGFYAQVASDGAPLETPITIQDQCYAFFPYIMAYRVTQQREYLERVWELISFIDAGPYMRADGTYRDSLSQDLTTECKFETPTLNIVSVIDFANLILIPTLRATPDNQVTPERKALLTKWVDFLVKEYWTDGIFWNDRSNRTDCRAKHVDLGHTSKSYGILHKANDLFERWGLPKRHVEIVGRYPEIAKAASAARVGWRTDFDVSATTFQTANLQWWRHILIDQTVFHYAADYPELIPLLENGVRSWLECDYVDRTRPCRGIREGLRSDGKVISNADEIECKANCWKNAYHEVEHVLTLCGEE